MSLISILPDHLFPCESTKEHDLVDRVRVASSPLPPKEWPGIHCVIHCQEKWEKMLGQQSVNIWSVFIM